jgi:mevalonate kinase|tara:strand:+ start:785 stop:1711 length:927 start_codon:yes stop_codon:yes gene_type:complete
MITASAPGKVILFGEHAMVYGELGIATAIEKRAKVTVCELDEPKIVVQSKNLPTEIELLNKDSPREPITKAARLALAKCDKKGQGLGIEINSAIPQSSGLGASAAIVTATAAAIMQMFKGELDMMQVAEIAYEAEKTIHTNPTGVETAVTTVGGTIAFHRGKVEALKTEPLQLIVANTGLASNAEAMISKVKTYIEDPRMGCTLFSIGGLVKQAKDAILHNQYALIGNLMYKNHDFLKNLGVSSPELENLMKRAKDAGSPGAKLTGFGGGGSMIALAKDPDVLVEALKASGAKVFKTLTGQSGVRVEE